MDMTWFEEMERRIARLKEEIADLEQRIKDLDNAYHKLETTPVNNS